MSAFPIVFRMGRRIYLRPLIKDDAALLAHWINDPEITQFLTASYPITPDEEVEWIDGLKTRKESDVILGIALKDSNELIGSMGLHRIFMRDQRATTGSLIGNKKYWGKGYGTEAKMLLLDYAFNTLNLRKICSEVYATNGRSKGCLEKCGYHQEGVLCEQVYRNGKFTDVIVMAVFKDKFLPLWEKYRKEFLDKNS